MSYGTVTTYNSAVLMTLLNQTQYSVNNTVVLIAVKNL